MARIVHLAIKVDNLDEATKFYEDVFGFKQLKTGRNGAHISRHLTDGAIDVILEHQPKKVSPLSFVPIFVMGGAYARPPDDATAFGGSRRTRYVFNISAGAMDPDSFAVERTWVRAFWDALRPFASSNGSYVNFITDGDEDRIRAAYGPEKYQRLSALKERWDPENVFHHNANIKPAS